MRDGAVRLLLALYERASGGGLFDRPVPKRAFESAYLAYKRLLEAGPLAELRATVAPGSVVVDVGANIGFFTVRFGRWVGPGGRVLAVEPEARNVHSLRRRVRAAGLGDVVDCVAAAASDRAGSVRLAVNPAHPGDHHLAENGHEVAAVTIDELLESDPRAVSLLKIDVQGAETLVLAGARRVIAEHRPAIFLEVDPEALARQGTSSRALLAVLDELGYDGFLPTRRGPGVALSAGAIAARSDEGYVDVLFRARSAAAC